MVVTIDFDIIMSPSIEAYNDMIEDDFRFDTWEEQFPMVSAIGTADLNIYNYLTQYIIKVVKEKPDCVHFITSHEQALAYMKGLTNISLVNIDHHHDISYDIDDWVTLLSDKNCGCANWVKALYDQDRLKEYFWIRDKNASQDILKPNKKVLTTSTPLEHYSLDALVKKTDVLIICASPEWIPSQFQPLFDTWVTMCEEISGMNFSVMDKS